MSAPDRVFIGSPPTKTCYGIAYAEKRGFATLEYLRATPARLHAEELAEALRDAVSALREIRDDNKARGALYSSKTQGLCRASLKVAGGALEKLENEERK